MEAMTKERLVNIRPLGMFDEDLAGEDDREVTATLLPVFREILPESAAQAAIRGVLARIGELRAGE